jgi:hypothetical protein
MGRHTWCVERGPHGDPLYHFVFDDQGAGISVPVAHVFGR